MEQIMIDTGEDREHGCEYRLVKRVNDWLREQGDKIVITHRQVGSDGKGYPIIWIFYTTR